MTTTSKKLIKSSYGLTQHTLLTKRVDMRLVAKESLQKRRREKFAKGVDNAAEYPTFSERIFTGFW